MTAAGASAAWCVLQAAELAPAAALPELVVRGAWLALETGAPWTAIECSDFALLAKWQSGADIAPVLEQRAAAGFNLVRVWTAFDIPGVGTFTAPDYAKVPAFVALCARHGLYVEFTAYTGINDPAHWDQLCAAAARCTPRPLLELVNELDQNTNEPDAAGRVFNLDLFKKAPAPLLSAHGSNGSGTWPVVPHWSYATMHFNDASEWPRKVGHNAMEVWSGPVLANENTRYSDRAQSTAWASDAAAGAALLCAGSCFHSVAGKTSDRWSVDEETAARAWAAGARGVNLACQRGEYRHAAELEAPTDLRVYQRVLSDGTAFTVRIRK